MVRTISVALMLVAGAWLAGSAQNSDVTGAWTVTITMADRQATGLAILSQDGTTITGMIGPAETDMMRPIDTVSRSTRTLMPASV